MLRYLRENTGNWVIKFFLLIIVVVFVFLGIGSINSGKHDVVAVVDGENISVQDFQTAYQNMMEGMRQQFGEHLNEELIKALNLKEKALDSLINQKLVEIQAEKLNIVVSDKELADSLLQIPGFQRNGTFDVEIYNQLLAANGMTPAVFEELQRNALKEQKLTDLIMDTVVISDLEAQQWYSYVNTRMAVDYVLLSPESFPADKPSDQAIETRYKEHESAYQSPARRKVDYLEFSVGDYLDKVTVTQEQIRAFYEQNPNRFNIPETVEARHILIKTDEKTDEKADAAALETAKTIYDKAIAGEDFATLAEKFSQGPSKDNGGYLGTFGRGEMVKEFEEAAFSLSAGQISKPVKTQFGWHVIQVMKKNDAVTRTLAQAAKEIKEELALQEAKGLAYEAAGKAFDSVIDGDDLEQVALIAEKKIQTTPAFDQTGKGLNLPDFQIFTQKAFELPAKTISDVIQLGDRYYILKVAEIIEPQTMPLEQVKDRIVSELQAAEQRETAKQTAEKILEKVNSGISLEKAAAEQNMKLASTDLFSRREAIPQIGSGPGITEEAFALTKEKPLSPKVLETSKGFVLIQFKDRQEPSSEEIDSRLESIRTQLVQLQKRQYYQEWLSSLRDKAVIEVEERFFQ